MKIARLVKISDLKNVEHLVKYSGKGMTTMPKTNKEIKSTFLVDFLYYLRHSHVIQFKNIH